MNLVIILVLVCGLPPFLFAQGDGEPCCNVIHIDPAKNVVTARDRASGRLHLFIPDASDMRVLKKGDAVNVSNGKITSISGAVKAYFTLKPDYSEPCCNIATVQPDAAQPCCAIVSFINNSNNQSYSVNVPKQTAVYLRQGQSVSLNQSNNLAVFLTAANENDNELVAYGFPVESGDASDKWAITANTIKGSSGRLLFDNPAGSVWDLYIYNAADDKYITSYANVNNKGLVTVVPGQYKITINNIPVRDVPIKKGHDTKLKCGLLDVRSEGVWYLKDATRKVSHTSGAKPSKLLIPVGTYTFELEGQNQTLIVKNGETVEM